MHTTRLLLLAPLPRRRLLRELRRLRRGGLRCDDEEKLADDALQLARSGAARLSGGGGRDLREALALERRLRAEDGEAAVR